MHREALERMRAIATECATHVIGQGDTATVEDWRIVFELLETVNQADLLAPQRTRTQLAERFIADHADRLTPTQLQRIGRASSRAVAHDLDLRRPVGHTVVAK